MDSETAFGNRWVTIRRDHLTLPDGAQTDYYLAERPHVALVFAQTVTRDVLLVEQYKHGAGTRTLELPGGTFTADEQPATAAARGLREETGYVCPDGLQPVAAFYDDASKNTNTVHVFAGTGARQEQQPELDAMEHAAGLRTVLVPRQNLVAMLADGTIRALSSVAAIHSALAGIPSIDR